MQQAYNCFHPPNTPPLSSAAAAAAAVVVLRRGPIAHHSSFDVPAPYFVFLASCWSICTCPYPPTEWSSSASSFLPLQLPSLSLPPLPAHVQIQSRFSDPRFTSFDVCMTSVVRFLVPVLSCRSRANKTTFSCNLLLFMYRVSCD